MEFRVLGPLEVRHDNGPLALGVPRSRTLLGILLTAPNSLVSVDRIIDEFWPDQAPAGGRDLVHCYMARLRRTLRSDSNNGGVADRLVTRKPGYLLRVENGELDRHRFQQLLTDARAATQTGRLDDGLARYRDANRLWRGVPWADAPPTAAIAAAATALNELRLTSLEEQYEISLRLGHGANLVAELTELAATHPLRERLVGLLVRSLHQAGRAADAIELCQQTRQRLADDLGIDLGAELRQIHLSILRGDPTGPRH